MGDGPATRQLLFARDLVEMDPLLIAGRLGKAIDTILSDLNPFAGSDLGADRRFEFTEVAEDAHVGFPSNVTLVWSDLQFRNARWNEQISLRHRHNFRDGDAGGGLQQRYLSAGKPDHGHVRHDEVDRPRRGQRQAAYLNDLRFPFCGMLHGDDDTLG